MNDPKISEYFSKMSKRRKTVAGGFKDPEVRKKALEARKQNKAKNVRTELEQVRSKTSGQE